LLGLLGRVEENKELGGLVSRMRPSFEDLTQTQNRNSKAFSKSHLSFQIPFNQIQI
jgi:hypothetical protein